MTMNHKDTKITKTDEMGWRRARPGVSPSGLFFVPFVSFVTLW